jgi:hypothetical protein
MVIFLKEQSMTQRLFLVICQIVLGWGVRAVFQCLLVPDAESSGSSTSLQLFSSLSCMLLFLLFSITFFGLFIARLQVTSNNPFLEHGTTETLTNKHVQSPQIIFT